MLPQGYKLQGRYVIDRVLGEGGMGAVYLARQDRIGGKKVAIKEMIVELHDPGARERAIAQFRKEAEILYSLDHLGLTKVIAFFVEGGAEYLVMEYVDGETLDHLFHKQRQFLTVNQVVGWIDQLCEVLTYLHLHDPPVIFRDLKPSNVMLDSAGRIRLIDFGIARNFDPAGETTTFIKGAGTHGFAPVEQYGTGTTDARSDVYSLGATMYVLLTRTLPPPSIAIMSGEERLWHPTQFNPAVPPAIDAVIMKCMSIRKEDRYQTIGAVRDALDEAMVASATLTMTSRFCTTCFASLEPGTQYCKMCGAPAQQTVDASPTPGPGKDVSQAATEIPAGRVPPQPAPAQPMAAPPTATLPPEVTPPPRDSGVHKRPPFVPPPRSGSSGSFAKNNPAAAAAAAAPAPAGPSALARPPALPTAPSVPTGPPSLPSAPATATGPRPRVPSPGLDRTVAVSLDNQGKLKRPTEVVPDSPPRLPIPRVRRPPTEDIQQRVNGLGWPIAAIVAISIAIILATWLVTRPKPPAGGGTVPEGHTSSINVRSTPEGAAVMIDGRDKGITPLQNVAVADGSHVLNVSKPGYETQTMSMQAPANAPIDVVLHESVPVLTINLVPDDVRIETDKTVVLQHVGSSTTMQLSVGHHDLVFSKPGYSDKSVGIDITSTTPDPLQITLTPVGTEEATLEIQSSPMDAEVYVDGTKVGQTPYKSSTRTGLHTIKLVKPGFQPYEVSKQLENGQTTRIQQTLVSQ